jgi:hypothetical protein
MVNKRVLCATVIITMVLAAGILAAQNSPAADTWKFAVSGDSRNCGDVVMPTIAADMARHKATFYWHLGDLRATYTFDEDYSHQPEHAGRMLSLAEYQGTEWQDFIDNQISAFGNVPFFLGIGNHETTPPRSREEFIAQFSNWLDSPSIRAQRLHDDPHNFRVRTYYHWRERNVDFINLDNASLDQFEPEQMLWFERLLECDQADPGVKTIVVGMHEALPDSLGDDHSMSQSPTGLSSGRQAYRDLLNVAIHGHKHVYILASHSHFYLENIFNTDYISRHGGVLPGWIVGTAGAVRYELPAKVNQGPGAQQHVYGYLLGTVSADGMINFDFQNLEETSVPAAIVNRYKPEFVHWCWDQNSQAPKMIP